MGAVFSTLRGSGFGKRTALYILTVAAVVAAVATIRGAAIRRILRFYWAKYSNNSPKRIENSARRDQSPLPAVPPITFPLNREMLQELNEKELMDRAAKAYVDDAPQYLRRLIQFLYERQYTHAQSPLNKWQDDKLHGSVMLHGIPKYSVDAGEWTFTEGQTMVVVPKDLREFELDGKTRRPDPCVPKGGSFEVQIPPDKKRILWLDPVMKVKEKRLKLKEKYLASESNRRGPPPKHTLSVRVHSMDFTKRHTGPHSAIKSRKSQAKILAGKIEEWDLTICIFILLDSAHDQESLTSACRGMCALLPDMETRKEMRRRLQELRMNRNNEYGHANRWKMSMEAYVKQMNKIYELAECIDRIIGNQPNTKSCVDAFKESIRLPPSDAKRDLWGANKLNKHVPDNMPSIDHWITRKDIEKMLLQELMDDSRDEIRMYEEPQLSSRGTHIEGFGGVGKTAMATWVVRRPEIAKQFPCRFWVQMQQDPDIVAILGQLYTSATFGAGRLDLHGKKNDQIDRARARLKLVLKGKRCLLVVDDVWCDEDLEPLQGIIDKDVGSRLLVTTRMLKLSGRSREEGRIAISINKLTDQEAEQLLLRSSSDISDICTEEEADAVRCLCKFCRNHALSISMIASRKHHDDCSWSDLLKKTKQTPVTKLSFSRMDKKKIKKQRYETVEQCIDINVESMDCQQKSHYMQLVVVPEDEWIPLELLKIYWNVDDEQCSLLINSLQQRSLIEVSNPTTAEDTRKIKTHDLLRDYLLDRVEDKQQREFHEKLIGALKCTHVAYGYRLPTFKTSRSHIQVNKICPISQYAGKNLAFHVEHARFLTEPQRYIDTDLGWVSLIVDGDDRFRLGRHGLVALARHGLKGLKELRLSCKKITMPPTLSHSRSIS